MALLLLQGSASLRAALAVPSTRVMSPARICGGRRVPAASRHRGRAGLCCRRLACARFCACGLGL
eukprot:14981674-Alexandrium_andersonii.AAC.1